MTKTTHSNGTIVTTFTREENIAHLSTLQPFKIKGTSADSMTSKPHTCGSTGFDVTPNGLKNCKICFKRVN